MWHPTLGHLPLRRLDRERIAAVVNELSATRADQTTANAHGLLSAMLAQAVEDGLLGSNPSRGIRLPRRTDHETPEHRYLTHGEFEQLLACIPPHYQPPVLCLAGTGARWGEIEALTVADVDLSGTTPTLRINKAAKWRESGTPREVGPTKTRKSRRTIALPVQVADVLRPLVDGRPGSDRLFLTPRGDHLRHSELYHQWKRACGRAGLTPRPRLHDLRHSRLWEAPDGDAAAFHDWPEWNGVDAKHNRSTELARLRQQAHRKRKCERGEHDQHCPSETCPRKLAKSASRRVT